MVMSGLIISWLPTTEISAWIVDFEFAEIISDMDDAKHSKLYQEMEDINTLLEGIKNHRNLHQSCGNGSEETRLGNGTLDSG